MHVQHRVLGISTLVARGQHRFLTCSHGNSSNPAQLLRLKPIVLHAADSPQKTKNKKSFKFPLYSGSATTPPPHPHPTPTNRNTHTHTNTHTRAPFLVQRPPPFPHTSNHQAVLGTLSKLSLKARVLLCDKPVRRAIQNKIKWGEWGGGVETTTACG